MFSPRVFGERRQEEDKKKFSRKAFERAVIDDKGSTNERNLRFLVRRINVVGTACLLTK